MKRTVKKFRFTPLDGKGAMKKGGKVKKMMGGGAVGGMYGESATEKQMKNKKPAGMMGGGKVPGYKAGKTIRGYGKARGGKACKMR